ncbi:MAG: stage II sporulation protein P [Clostridia bacterium]|nr:stage II sporulation protein P [Clostridia bacterium]
MKRYRHYRNNRHTYAEPTAFAWILLLLAWIAVVTIAVWIIFPNVRNQSTQAETVLQTNEPTPTETAESSQEEPEKPESVACIFQTIPAIHALRSEAPTVLIYHTHTTEAYTQTETEQYKENGKWRTSDNTKNVVAVGEVLKEILERDYGFHVIHDTTDHEPPKLSTAYERSVATMERYHEEYPSIVLFIDLHRDAYSGDTAPCDYLTINGTETARLMLVVGKGEKYSDKPYYDSNIAFAERITAHLNTINEKLCRPVRVKTGRYNQHVAPNCILVEVGHNANTLSQAKAAMPYFAESIAYAFRTEPVSQSDWLPN